MNIPSPAAVLRPIVEPLKLAALVILFAVATVALVLGFLAAAVTRWTATASDYLRD